jgi:sugar/nucleoside kinase (ribokinase family)
MGTPDVVVIGHIARDLLPDGSFRLGGTAFYAAVAASRLGLRTAVYTAVRPDLDLSYLKAQAGELTIVFQSSSGNTIFENRYRAGKRQQFLLSRARVLSMEDLPAEWLSAPLVLLGPIAQELSPNWVQSFSSVVVGACLQGWLRTWNSHHQVAFAPWPGASRWLAQFSVAFLSEEDIRDEPTLAEKYAERCPLLVLTRGEQGAVLYQRAQPTVVAPFPVHEVDPTGAGDVFATAFLVRLAEGAPPVTAARFAAAAAALSVRGEGGAFIPYREDVERLVQESEDVVPPS